MKLKPDTSYSVLYWCDMSHFPYLKPIATPDFHLTAFVELFFAPINFTWPDMFVYPLNMNTLRFSCQIVPNKDALHWSPCIYKIWENESQAQPKKMKLKTSQKVSISPWLEINAHSELMQPTSCRTANINCKVLCIK